MKATENTCEVSAPQPGNQISEVISQLQRCCQASQPEFSVMVGLAARKRLCRVLERELSYDENLAVLVIKVSDLGQINYSKGYAAGDEVIRVLVRRINTWLVNVQFVGRLGGGRFLAIARSRHKTDNYSSTIEQMITCLSLPIELPAGPVYVSCSVGTSVAPADTGIADELLCNGELALHSAARGGYAFYLSELTAELSDRMAVLSALAGAMEREEFYLVYQPQVCHVSGSIFGVEALLRWKSESLGLVAPNRFIPVAEAAGLMPQIGNWVINQACQQARGWLNAGTPLRVAVNASAAQLETGDFVEVVRRALSHHQLPAHLLEIEVTESMLVRQVQDNRDALSAIRQLGVKLGLDDFGTGYSNLAYLRNFTFDTLKIDRLFVSALTDEHTVDPLVCAIIAIGEELGQEVIAEGVESETQKNALIKLGCTRMQGFLFGRPVPAGELERSALM